MAICKENNTPWTSLEEKLMIIKTITFKYFNRINIKVLIP